MRPNPTRPRRAWRTGLLTVVVAVVLASSAAAAPAATAETDEAGRYVIGTAALDAGQVAHGWWNNTPDGASYFVDVRPFNTVFDTSCQVEVLRTWRVRNRPPGTPYPGELEVHWEVKNHGPAWCQIDIWLAYVK